MTGMDTGITQAQRFESGLAAGENPQPADVPAGGDMITTGSSRWLGMRCRTCNQTFRRGDRVRQDASAGIQHLNPALRCASRAGGSAGQLEAGHDTERFTRGLLGAWPPLNGAPVVTLTAGNWQVTTPSSGPASPVCPGCGHTFRAGDTVIICPCAIEPGDGRRRFCGLPVHRDPVAGLACWDDWRPDGKLVRCPRTHDMLPD